MWSSSGFFAKAPTFAGWPVEERPLLLAFYRSLFACLTLAALIRRPRFSWRLLPMMAGFALMSLAYMGALVYAEATLAIWLQYTSPAWVLLLGALLFGESARRADAVYLLVALCGVAIIVAFQLPRAQGLGVWLGLAAGLCFAVVVLCLRSLRDHDAGWLIFLNHTATVLLLAPVVFGRGEIIVPRGEQWIYLIGFGLVQMGIPYILFARALRTVSSHEASGLLLLEPVLVPVWVYIAWRHHDSYEFPEWSTIGGAILIFASLIIRYGQEYLRQRSAGTAREAAH